LEVDILGFNVLEVGVLKVDILKVIFGRRNFEN
jgi:uncharacterized membrane protein YuzA (DUF378 family)